MRKLKELACSVLLATGLSTSAGGWPGDATSGSFGIASAPHWTDGQFAELTSVDSFDVLRHRLRSQPTPSIGGNAVPVPRYCRVPLLLRREGSRVVGFADRRAVALGPFDLKSRSFPIVPCLETLVAFQDAGTVLALEPGDVDTCNLFINDNALADAIITRQLRASVGLTGHLNVEVVGVDFWRGRPSVDVVVAHGDLVLHLGGEERDFVRLPLREQR